MNQLAITTLYTSDYITVEYNIEDGVIHHTIHQPIGEHPQIMKEAINIGTEALQKHQLCKWLSDDRNNGPLPDEIIEWAATDWNQRAISAGWRYWANIVPKELAAAGTLTPIIHDLADLGLKMHVFTTVEDGLKWLNSKSCS